MRLPLGFFLAQLELPFICNLVWSWPALLWRRLFLFLGKREQLEMKFKQPKRLAIGLMLLLAGSTQADCLESNALVALDGRYEEALRTGDVTFLQQLLADDFLWVHNLASAKESKAELLKRMAVPEETPKARVSRDISIQRLGDVAVLSGLSEVDKWNADGKTWRSLRYQFMRTYVKTGGSCSLLAVQTMKIWASEE